MFPRDTTFLSCLTFGAAASAFGFLEPAAATCEVAKATSITNVLLLNVMDSPERKTRDVSQRRRALQLHAMAGGTYMNTLPTSLTLR